MMVTVGIESLLFNHLKGGLKIPKTKEYRSFHTSSKFTKSKAVWNQMIRNMLKQYIIHVTPHGTEWKFNFLPGRYVLLFIF